MKTEISQQTQPGFSLLELMVTMAVMVVFFTIAVPGFTSMIVSSDLKSGQNDLFSALKLAKTVARTQNTKIKISLLNTSNEIVLRYPDNSVYKTVSLPHKVKPTIDAEYQFDSMGMVDAIGLITLKSQQSTTRSKAVRINSLFGQIILI